jgi:membrane carboxypeptidase/penicillin-binding protein
MNLLSIIAAGVRLRYRYKLNTPIAGKTGTTQNNSDARFSIN